MESMLPCYSTTGDRVVAVGPAAALAERPRLFAAFEAAFPVKFGPVEAVPDPAAIVEVGRGGSKLAERQPGSPAVPRIAFAEDRPSAHRVEDVRLLEQDQVDRRLRRITLERQLDGSLPGPSGEVAQVLAADSHGARWTVSSVPTTFHRVAGPLRELEPTELLRDALVSPQSLSIVAITHFLRALCAGSGFQAPTLRATIVFDDPNVRWRSYGFIDYRRLIAHADLHDYHAVMAMVPRDALCAHPATVSLFRQRRDRLSLALHGNDHVKDELMLAADDRSALSLGAQALRRIARFEARTGLSVDRVMIPPHGMCSKSVAWALGALGFDALCAIHPEPWSEEPDGARLLAGWGPATFAGQSAVIPRMPLYCSQTEISLRAFMDSPIVLYGHHEDLASGFDLLEQAAARVNALGDVRWMSLGAIATSNVGLRTVDDTVVVRPYAGRVRVAVPEGEGSLAVEAPRGSDGALVGWSCDPATTVPFGALVPIPSRGLLEIRLRPRVEVDPQSVPMPGWNPRAAVRRVVTETRDRAMPLWVARST